MSASTGLEQHAEPCPVGRRRRGTSRARGLSGARLAAVLLALAGPTLCLGAANTVIYPDGKPVSKELPKDENIVHSMPESDFQLLAKSVSLAPEQIHLTYWGAPSKMLVSFASGDGRVTLGPPPKPTPPSTDAQAQWGAAPGKLTNNASCATVGYVQDQYAWEKFPGYVSPYLSHCLLTGLPAGTRVFYRVGWPAQDEWSEVHNFTTLKAAKNFPLHIGVMSDMGTSYNASATVRQVAAENPDLVLNIGDLSYADIYLPDGKQGTIKKYYYSINYQPRWDMYGRMIQNLTSHVPMMVAPGNHDIEFQPDGTVFAALNHRYPVPQAPAGTKSGGAPLSIQTNRFTKDNPSPHNGLYYSFDIPGTAHVAVISSYIPNDTFAPGTPQYKWFEADLKAVDRSKTPWLIVMFHAPFISSYEDAFKQVECMRLTYEPLLQKYGVDVALNGHVHAYERSKPQYNYRLDPCGTIHITAGCGGKPGIATTGEYALDRGFIDDKPQPEYCADPAILNKKVNPTQPGPRCLTTQKDLGGYCWSRQPAFSAFRQPAVGHGSLVLINATHAEWMWMMNNDGPRKPVDRVVLNRALPMSCKTRR